MTNEEKRNSIKKIQKSIDGWLWCEIIIVTLTLIAEIGTIIYGNKKLLNLFYSTWFGFFCFHLFLIFRTLSISNEKENNVLFLFGTFIFALISILQTKTFSSFFYFYGRYLLCDIPIYVICYKRHIMHSLKSDEDIAMENAKKDREKKEKIKKQKIDSYNELINTCGFRFFLKYYSQIKAVAIKDIEIDDDLPYDEKLKRIESVKKIIYEGNTEFIVDEIIKNYSDNLTDKEIDLANNIKKQLI